MPLLRSESELTPDQLVSIGCIAVESATLDFLIDRIIWVIWKFNEDTGKNYTGRMSIDAKIFLLRELTVAKFERANIKADFLRICDGIARSRMVQNRVNMHREWYRPLEHKPRRKRAQ